jgi:hypothetical protein
MSINTEEFKVVYARRAGVEGTISQAVRVMGLRRSRSIGQEKNKLPCYFNAGENSPVAVSPDPVSTDVLVAAADL